MTFDELLDADFTLFADILLDKNSSANQLNYAIIILYAQLAYRKSVIDSQSKTDSHHLDS